MWGNEEVFCDSSDKAESEGGWANFEVADMTPEVLNEN